MRQDISYFDKDENSTGKLTSEISEKPQKVNAACGITLGVSLPQPASASCQTDSDLQVIIQNIFTYA
jgi:ATP-binding cassette subfamily B (MDR/TAP) protein 1